MPNLGIVTNFKQMKVKLKNPLIKHKELNEAEKERGFKQLSRLATIIDVIYGLLIFRLFMILPRPELDGFGKDELVEVLSTSYINYLVMLVGLIMILIYWGQSNLMFGNLRHTDGKHSTLSILQAFCLLIYFYFVRLDVELDGAVIALQMESVFLALSGFFGIAAWYYSEKNGLISSKVDHTEKTKIYLKLIPEPLVSVLTFPFAVFGPDIWTLSWLLLIPVGFIIKKISARMKTKQIDNNI